ncbi:MAG: methyltransferase domain-containing protein [Elusimicrobia bacterium]|nr:methyltransferase domain-containing protein [Elusimicrobiota bacterium]
MNRSPLSRAEILALAAVLSFCSLVYELDIAACFVSITGDAPFWESLTLGIYLAALGAGALACSRRPDSDPWPSLWRVEAALAVAGGACAAGVLALETAFRIYSRFYASGPSLAIAVVALALGHGFTVLVGWLSGFELPLLMRAARRDDGSGAEAASAVLGLNYFGALAGSLAFSFWLLPRLGLLGSTTAASALNLAACAFLLRRGPLPASAARLTALGAAAAAWLALALGSPALSGLEAASCYAQRLGVIEEVGGPGNAPLGRILRTLWRRAHAVERVPSRYQRLELVNGVFKDSPLWSFFNHRLKLEPGLPYGLSLFLDRHFQFRGGAETVYHEYFAHVPVQIFSRVPQDVLILGGGDGLLARELLKYDGVRSITDVELDPAMVELALRDPRLRLLNSDSFRNPKVRVVTGDAFFFVRNDRATYDAVYIDFPFPHTYDTAKLYTAEFYRNVARRLRPGGFGALDYPMLADDAGQDSGKEEGLRKNSIIVNTLLAAGLKTIVPFSVESPELVAAWQSATLEPRPEPDIDPEISRLLRRVAAKRFLRKHPGVVVNEKEDLDLVSNRSMTETFLAFTPERSQPDFDFKDNGVILYALTPLRLKTLEGGHFSFRDDPQLVNTLLRPTLFKPLGLQSSSFD